MNLKLNLFLVSGLLVVTGCAGPDSGTPGSAGTSEPTGKQYLAATEPAGAIPVGQARTETVDGNVAALVGYIGGSAEPFVNGLAAFTIVDPGIEACPADCGCPTPWDYCCTLDQLPGNIATVKVVDPRGQPLAEDARPLLGVREMALVVVEGTVQLDDQGNLSILARKVFVRN